ncbi:hypothetical protein [Pseudomonas petrae]|uniref:hypothetical protein n=1 Tax=Pseudomonas petrae TaxID=2912190 RepID=UPI001F414CF1|nr:hypothetical protein [Pseudomonas petrae]MCF7532013.1 hypothetical protein [Pseudomonas petrae]
MTINLTQQQVRDRIVQAASDVVNAEHHFREARAEIKRMYEVYFQAHGRPEGEFLPYTEPWEGVRLFTASANGRRAKARKVLRNAQARMERAVHALERDQ